MKPRRSYKTSECLESRISLITIIIIIIIIIGINIIKKMLTMQSWERMLDSVPVWRPPHNENTKS